ncbi:hypothetical protein AAFC00_004861 [Neodothiora populina]|uniref:DnaJ homologue subfamily C member 28 conserved domain-containing protein n=1 Tax=Neodothiora populina TaxID=2781224 RepID=A0ABR3P3L0_9PEZI
MSRRLAQLSEEGLENSGRRAAKMVEESGFDEDLKRQLEERIKNASFKSEYASAFAQVNMPSSAGKGTRDIAGARAWDGEESLEDAALRMLDDSIKPMKGSGGSSRAIRAPPIRIPTKIDTGRSRAGPKTGTRLANARDQTSVYASLKDLPEDEREQFRKEMKERFSPAARSAPVSVRGLESLANERIEDAIARGKFKNLPRGKKIERDHNASSPFINTTEYLLNGIIQRQDIVPPWIDKQQELVSTAARFRGRLRADWRRHVARSIASKGGGLASQMALAEEYAFAEAVHNPQSNKKEKINTVDESGHLSQITLAGELTADKATPGAQTPVELKITEQAIDESGKVIGTEREEDTTVTPIVDQAQASVVETQPRTSTVPPFRDADWLQTELSYQKLAIDELNALTRSYNLMCPQLAQRPYFDLQRELNSCYADVAPLIAKEIEDRANAPKNNPINITTRPVSRLENFVGSQARVYDEVKPQYGFKDLIKDWFGRKKDPN